MEDPDWSGIVEELIGTEATVFVTDPTTVVSLPLVTLLLDVVSDGVADVEDPDWRGPVEKLTDTEADVSVAGPTTVVPPLVVASDAEELLLVLLQDIGYRVLPDEEAPGQGS